MPRTLRHTRPIFMTRTQIQYIQSLSRQKYRKQYNAYLVEGEKNAKEWLRSATQLLLIVATEDWLAQHQELIALHPEATQVAAKGYELEKISALHTPQQVLLVAQQPESSTYPTDRSWTLLLEHIQDPGNMGTLIRIADWFGIKTIICTPDCVERYNPKVVQATMGSLLRVNFHTSSLEDFLVHNQQPVYATCLDGQPLQTFTQPVPGIIAMGNESQGLSPALLEAARYKLTIPGKGKAESLNVAVAAGIVCAQLTL